MGALLLARTPLSIPFPTDITMSEQPMADHEKATEDAEGDRGDREEVDRLDGFPVIVKRTDLMEEIGTSWSGTVFQQTPA